MKSIKIKSSKLNGKVIVPPSKSLSHRAIICASLCNTGESVINNIDLSQDIEATIEGMKIFGAEINIYKNRAYIKRNNLIKQNPFIDCRESGSTLRFLIPVSLILTNACSFTGSQKLFERPLDVYYDIFNKQNIDYKVNSSILNINGQLSPGCFEIPGNVSSQFISGLLFSLPLLKGDSTIIITGNFESKPYVDLTIEVLNKFGIIIEKKDDKVLFIQGSQDYKSFEYSVEGDYSQAAFFLVANELGNNIECLGLEVSSLQGDKEILNIINKFKNNNDEITIDASQIPDIIPIISVLAALKEGCITRITNAQRLRIKESDRLHAVATEMKKLGADIKETKDGLVILGKNELYGGVKLSSWNDHRIAMSLAIAATKCKNNIILEDYMVVKKSYPHFWEDYNKLGGVTIELDDRK